MCVCVCACVCACVRACVRVKLLLCGVLKRVMIWPQYISVDGNSLSTDDLMHLGKGEYKIKVSTPTGSCQGSTLSTL